MKILHIITTINRGGAENHLRDLIEGQIKEFGCDIACAYLKGDGYWESDLNNLGAKVFPLNLTYYGDLKPIFTIINIIKEFKPNLIHAHLAPAELYSRIALLRYPKLPYIISKHNESNFYPGPGSNIIEQWVIRRASKIIAISNSVKRYYSSRWKSLLSNRIIVIHYGINFSSFQNISSILTTKLRSEWNIDNSTILIGTIARLVPVKAIHILLDGYAKYIKNNESITTKLVIVGTGPIENKLKCHANNLGLTKHVVWAGFRQDIPLIINTIDIFALTSTSEGFGLVLLEAMSAGKPVIATNISAIPEIVINGTTGMLIPPNNPKKVSECFDILIKNKELRLQYGENGRRRVKVNFSLREMYSLTIEIYKNVLCK